MSAREDIMDMVDEMLDADGDICIGGVYFVRSQILKEMDPIAYAEVCSNYIDARLVDLQDDLDRLDPELDADEVESIQEMIEELEDFSV
jgi:hypothetical protein